jgi:hypothetical protein
MEDSPVTVAYERILKRPRPKKAKVAVARYLLRIIYYMTKRRQTYDEYIIQRRGHELNLLHKAKLRLTLPIPGEGQNMALL